MLTFISEPKTTGSHLVSSTLILIYDVRSEPRRFNLEWTLV